MEMLMSSGEKLVFREYPRTFWLSGIATVIIGNWVSDSVTQHIVFSLLGALLFGFSTILTVTVDPSRAVLNLRYRSLLHRSSKTFRFEEICAVYVAEDSEGERMYRIELVLCSGKRVPLR